ncbi:MAG TPA: sulfatase, partial [Armatimonadaceae bacterium]|nr:sulfatase [Armatimonadaceae bacterium]
LPLDRETVADALKRAGYATAMFGKWHLGNGPAYHPSRRGFDVAHATGRAAPHFTFQYRPPVTTAKPGAYLADVNTDLAVDFIEKHTGRNRDQPFFLYLPYNAVHSPHQAKPETIARFRGKPPVGGHKDPTYAAMIASLDEGVGRILSTLDRLKLRENTVVVFASDNGGVGGYGEIGGRGITDNAPLRGGKGMLYEGGLRVPFVVRWPGVIPPGTVSDRAAAHIDLFPTFLEVAGVTAARPKQVLDGLSLVPALRDPKAKLAREALYFHFPGYLEGHGTRQWRTVPVGAIRAGDWKLMEFYEDGRLELYNLKDDPGEKKNLAAAQPERAKALRAKLDAWRKATNAAMPTPKSAKGSAP